MPRFLKTEEQKERKRLVREFFRKLKNKGAPVYPRKPRGSGHVTPTDLSGKLLSDDV